jgi:hypothetical protein
LLDLARTGRGDISDLNCMQAYLLTEGSRKSLFQEQIYTTLR